MTFYDEHNKPVSSQQDMMFVSVSDEDDYMSALEQVLNGSNDIESRYSGPGLYLPEDSLISGNVYLTLVKVNDKAIELSNAVRKLEDELRLAKYRLRILEGVSAAS